MYKVTGKERRRLRNAWNKASKTYHEWLESGQYQVVPIARSFEEELSMITTKREYNRRLKELQGVSKKGADKAVKFHDIVMPQYMRTQIRNTARMLNSKIKEWRSADYYNLDEMSAPQKAAAMANNDLDYIYEEDYVESAEDFNSLIELEYPNMPEKAEVYISVWEDMNGDEDIPEIIRFLVHNDPEGFEDLARDPFNEEYSIEYIYPEVMESFRGNKSGFNYKRSTANKTAFQTRMENAADFWRNQYMEYQEAKGYWSIKPKNRRR